jgi:filamentous hemagglutinin family protein
MEKMIMRRISSKMVYAICSAACVLSAASPVSANPQGATVVHGNAQFSNPNANTLQVDSTGNSIINWQSFSIGQSETTRFNQASASNAVLNRVTGPDASNLLGNLSSNGHVFLINSNGIVIGEHARIDTASFVASTLDISNQDFLNGHLAFAGDNAGGIINRGFITAGAGGEIVLVAPQIENHGVLSVEDGRILLAAGEKVTISSLDLNGIEFEVQAPDNSVLNVGELIASKGSVGIFAGSIKHEGVIAADSIGIDATGNIVLHAQANIDVGDNAMVSSNGDTGGGITMQSETGDTVVRGTVEATGIEEQGGEIKILGNRVGLFGDAYVDASGKTGGGEILVGGDYQGKGETQTAQQTQLSSEAGIHADALQQGDGGKVIVWADGFTEAHGAVSAKGGSEKGDGGFVEISGKGNLTFSGSVDTSAANGEAGTALFDPRDIVITGIGGIAYDPANDGFIESPAALFTMDAASLALALGTQNVILQANNDISYQNATMFVGAGGNDLTLQAGRSINIVATQTGFDLGGGNLTLIANSRLVDGVVDAQRGAGAANITIGDGAQFTSVNTGGGNIVMEIRDGAGLTNNTAGSIIINDIGTLSTLGGDITIRADNGYVMNGTGSSVNAGAGAVTIDTYSPGATIDLGASGAGDQVIDGANLAQVTAGSLNIGNSNTGDITVLGGINFNPAAPTTIRTGGNIVFNQGNGNDGIISDAGSITLNAGGAIRDLSDNSANGADVAAGINNLDLNAVSGIDIESGANQLRFNNTGQGAVQISSNLGVNGTLVIAGGNNSATGFSTIIQEQSGNIDISGNVTHNASFGTIISAAQNVTNNANITGNGGGTVLRSAGPGTVTNNGVITDSGNIALVAATGGTVVNAGSIGNAGSANNIVLEADDIQLNGGSINAGALAKTVLRRTTIGNWTLGGNLTAAELNTIAGAIAVGDSNNTLNNLILTAATALTNNQDLLITTTGAVDFQQSAGDGITGANLVRIDANQVSNAFSGSLDVAANRLEINTAAGIGGTNALDTRVNQLVATNSTSGSINIANSGGNVTIAPTGIRNFATGGTDDIVINNANGNININGVIQADGGSITVATTTANDITVTTDIFTNGVAAPVALNSGRDLIFDATNSVNGNGVNVRSASGDINLGAANNIRVLGGNAANEWVEVDAGNLLNVFAGNNLLLQGGSAQDARAALSGSNGASVFAAGNVAILGGSGVNGEAVINASGSMNVSAGGTLSLTGGSGNDANALISTDDSVLPLDIVIDAGGDVTLTGGTGQNAVAAIATDSAPISIIMGSDGPIGGNLNLVAGSGGGAAGGGYGALALIGAVETGEATAININVAGSINMRSNVSSGDNAFIGSQTGGGDMNIIAGSSTAGGNINIDGRIQTAGDLMLTANPGTVNSGDIVLNGGAVIVNALNIVNANLFSMQDGLLQLNGASIFNNPFEILGGTLDIRNALTIAGDYTQTAGSTLLQNSVLNVTGQFDLLGGALTGNGTVTTPVLNNVAGIIAPGSNRPVTADTAPGIGMLTIDGDLIMGAAAVIRFDLGGADLPDSIGSGAGELYDSLNVTGDLALGGTLSLVVDVPRYRGRRDDRFQLLTYGSISGDPENVTLRGVPLGYQFAPRIGANASGAVMLLTPFDLLASRITGDEIESLNRKQQEHLDELVFMEKERRRRLQAKEREEQKDKERRAAANCT